MIDSPSKPMVEIRCQIRPDTLRSEDVLAFDWRELTALGVPWEEARLIAVTLITKQLMLRYWRRLIRAEVPADDARRLARAIAKYDLMDLPPTLHQQQLLQRYCPAVCRSGLWRVEMLLRVR